MSSSCERWERFNCVIKRGLLQVGARCNIIILINLFQLSEVMVEMGSNLMQVDDQILALAQREKRACSSIVYSLETLAWPQLHSHAQDFSMVQI